MKKALAILILAALLSGCAQMTEPNSETVPTTSSSAIITEREDTPAVTSKATSREVSTTPKATEPKATTTTITRTTTTTAPVSTTTAAVSATETSSRTTTQLTTTEPVLARQEPVSATTTRATAQTERPTTRTATTTIASTEAMPRTTTTAQPTATTTKKITVPKPPITTRATTTVIENGITYVEVPDVTCLATMIENLEETDTPPSYYIQIGKSLKHDGTDYSKAVAVYDWMSKNGWGSCVYHSLETYYVCQGIGLECAYAFCTDIGWYGHTYNAVKVEGEWYVLDTQAHTFLDNTSHRCRRIFDGNDRDLEPYDEWIWYPYDRYGEYRNWTVEPAE